MRNGEKSVLTEPLSLDLHETAASREPERVGTSIAGSAARTLALLGLIAEHRKLLLKVLVWGLLASLAVAFLIPVRYEAVTRLMPPDQTTGMSASLMGALTAKAGDGIGAVASDLLGMHTTGATLMGILTSRTVSYDLINRFDLRKVYSKSRYESARKILLERTEVSEDRKSGIITISVRDADAARAATLARGYVDELNWRVSQLTTSSARRERMFLEERLQSVKRQLDQASLDLSRFSSKNRTFDPQIEGKTELEAAATLQGQLIAAESEFKGLQQIYGPENARVRSAAARIAELRSKLHRLSGSSPGEPAGDAANGELYPSIEQLPLLGNTYYDLARQAKIDEAVYEALTKQYELAKVDEAKEIPTIKVLDEPVVPDRRVSPPRLTIIILGTILALFLGILWLVVREVWSAMDSTSPYKLMLGQLREMFTGDNNHREQRLPS
jgi:capsule polysaccharide export protein KpsE/RkpR